MIDALNSILFYMVPAWVLWVYVLAHLIGIRLRARANESMHILCSDVINQFSRDAMFPPPPGSDK